MKEGTRKTIIWETNSEPPKDWIGVTADGVAREFDRINRVGEESQTIITSENIASSDEIDSLFDGGSSGSGSDSGSDSGSEIEEHTIDMPNEEINY